MKNEQQTVECREAFEERFKNMGVNFLLDSTSGNYFFERAYTLYEGWQAAWNSRSPEREYGWRSTERQELAEECARYFSGYSFSRHELAQCLGLIDVLISKNLIAKPSKNTEIEGDEP